MQFDIPLAKGRRTRVEIGDAVRSRSYATAVAMLFAAFLMRATTASGWETYTAWLAFTSLTVAPARFDIARYASGGSILTSVATRYQLGFVLHAAVETVPCSAATPHGSWEFAMKSALTSGTSPANDAANLLLSSIRYPSWAGRIGGIGA